MTNMPSSFRTKSVSRELFMGLLYIATGTATCNNSASGNIISFRSFLANNVNVEMRRSQRVPQPHPQREKHLRAARVGDVPEVNDVPGLPAEPFGKPVGHFAFGRRVVAADEQLVIARYPGRRNHDLAIHPVERLHYPHLGKFALR